MSEVVAASQVNDLGSALVWAWQGKLIYVSTHALMFVFAFPDTSMGKNLKKNYGRRPGGMDRYMKGSLIRV